jgi:hypothetical protein
VPQPVADPIRWRLEAAAAVLVAAYCTLLGGVAGLVWSHVAPKIYDPTGASRLLAAFNGSEAATKVLLGDDMSYAFVMLGAGVVSVAILTLVGRRHGAVGGPGAMVGLAVGGLLGALVAAHLGHDIQRAHLVSAVPALRATDPHITRKVVLFYFDFEVRIRQFFVIWPITAVVLQGLVVGARRLRTGR